LKRHHIFFFCWLVHLIGAAQDFQFSQFTENPALLNPALTGSKNPLRASVSFKEQSRGFNSNFKTFGLSFETRLTQSEWKQVDKYRTMTFREKSISRLAVGLSIYSDQAGDAELGTTLSNLSLAYFIPLNSSQFLSFGFQASAVQKKINNASLIFPNQYNGETYDPLIYSGENFTSLYYVYADFSTGFLWSYKHKEERVGSGTQTKINFGLSVFHINKQNETFLMNGNNLNRKYVAHGELLFYPNSKNIALNPSFVFQQQTLSHQLIIGTMVKYFSAHNSKYTGFLKRSSIGFGCYYKSPGQLVAAMSLEKKEQYCINISYDAGILPIAGYSGAARSLELLLRFTLPHSFLYQKKVKLSDD
jgi:type IX secretion system PorP/SprF family membrane protein